MFGKAPTADSEPASSKALEVPWSGVSAESIVTTNKRPRNEAHLLPSSAVLLPPAQPAMMTTQSNCACTHPEPGADEAPELSPCVYRHVYHCTELAQALASPAAQLLSTNASFRALHGVPPVLSCQRKTSNSDWGTDWPMKSSASPPLSFYSLLAPFEVPKVHSAINQLFSQTQSIGRSAIIHATAVCGNEYANVSSHTHTPHPPHPSPSLNVYSSRVFISFVRSSHTFRHF